MFIVNAQQAFEIPLYEMGHPVHNIFFYPLACCLTLTVTLGNEFKYKLGYFHLEGIYSFHGIKNDMDYWVHSENREFAIWFVPAEQLTDEIGWIYRYSHWCFGYKSMVGQSSGWMTGANPVADKKCPEDGGYPWSWSYADDSNWIPTTSISIKCKNEDDFCTTEKPCEQNEGDCDNHIECQSGLVCGTNNCPDFLGLNSDMDCCYNSTIGDEHFCTTENPCEEDEGDCDSNDECQGDLRCDIIRGCPESLGFNSDVACCSSTACADPQWVNDFYCHDISNTEECLWDGGDCCGDNVNTHPLSCSECACLDPNA